MYGKMKKSAPGKAKTMKTLTPAKTKKAMK